MGTTPIHPIASGIDGRGTPLMGLRLVVIGLVTLVLSGPVVLPPQ
ncbi:MAG: hypothetical protein ACE5G5_14345 [Candidatus Methylomirabilales bacterium]